MSLPIDVGTGVRRRKRQVHVFLSAREYEWLRDQASLYDETLSSTIRRLLNVPRRTDPIVSRPDGRPGPGQPIDHRSDLPQPARRPVS